MILTQFCPAKVNLFLEVTGKRPNGYHELATLFAKIKLGDELIVDAAQSEQTSISLQITGPLGKRLPTDETNLVCRATRGFLEQTGLNATVQITLHKRVPTGAGLGGGSSDAAGTLLALCKIFKKDQKEFLPLAAKLGADVPLFMYEESFLKGEGIGEILTPVSAGDKLPWLVLVYPNTFISTKMVFGNFHLASKEEIAANVTRLENLIACIKNSPKVNTWKPFLLNRLETCVAPICPSVQQAIADLHAQGAPAVLMSGSGSTVFALCDSSDEAEQLARKVCTRERTVFCTPFYIGHQ